MNSIFDKLTGLYNRNGFFLKVEEQLKESTEEDFLIICSDVKNFKLVNDIFGMAAGDELLLKITEAIQKNNIPSSVYGRLENDRFALFLPVKYKQLIIDSVVEKAFRIERAVDYLIHIDIGIYEITDREIPVSIMCDRAIMALNTIKENLQEVVAYYDDAMRAEALKEQELVGRLQRAIEEEELQIHLQPQVDCNGKGIGAEALIRWQHPEKGLLMPGAFIELFENNGMIAKVDRYIWETVCRQLKKWKEEGRKYVYLSVNISPKDFYYMDICQVFTDLVKKYDIAPENLRLEITETAFMKNSEQQLKLIDKLRENGFIVEMDDFGSGYSSLNMLKDIEVDIMKLDMKFFSKTKNEDRAKKILKMVVGLSKELNMPVIAEGVETEEQVKFLTKIGCNMFQGYFFAKPMPVSQFEERYLA